MGRAQRLKQASAGTGPRTRSKPQTPVIKAAPDFSHEHLCRRCNGSGRDETENDISSSGKCTRCEGRRFVIDTANTQELYERREAAIAATAQGLPIQADIVENCLMGSALPSDPRIGRILEAWVSSERENKTAAPDRYILDDFELALPNSKYRSGMLTSATTKALKEQWPDVYETVIRAAVNNAVDQGLEIDPYTLRDRAILEAQTRFVALRFGAVQAGNNGKWANCPLQKMLSLNIYERFSEQLGARRFRRDQPLESILSASDYYQAFTAAQLEHAAEMQVSLRRQPARLSSYRCRDALIRLLEVKVAIKASERAHARDRGISNSGHEEALQLHALAAGIKSGHTVYKQEVTGSTTFRVWTEKVQEHYTSDKENLRDFDTAVAGDIEAAGIYIKALKTAVSTGNDRLEQDRFEILQLRLANFDDALTGRDHNVDALTEQRVLAEFEPGAIDAQAALQLLDQQSGD